MVPCHLPLWLAVYVTDVINERGLTYAKQEKTNPPRA
jgi:hypothetical protein